MFGKWADSGGGHHGIGSAGGVGVGCPILRAFRLPNSEFGRLALSIRRCTCRDIYTLYTTLRQPFSMVIWTTVLYGWT